ncbi:MAG: glutamate--tRNA ligase [Flavobacteriales bacterium]|nr:glutamate--tRNA ligase [Flavobacteriales bacterium]|tara:strand:- start:11960 stop:13483 length:1524 start_codon:yes stop_codon:yes gene_type:complete
MSKVRVRYAPSPTGPQHVGGIRTALYNYLFAKKLGGDVVLRIEDTDEKRFVEGAEQYIIESIKWCGFDFDEGVHKGGPFGPYKQSERKDIYLKYSQQLIDDGKAYYAFDTSDELHVKRVAFEKEKKNFKYDFSTRDSMRNSLVLSDDEVQNLLNKDVPYTVRFKIEPDNIIVVDDMVRGEVRFNSSELDDKIIFKSDGMPTYHLANIVDDHLMEISHVIRGEEWLPSAPLHVAIYEAFGWNSPKFAHLPLLLKPTGKGKLSKRDGDAGGFPVFPLEWKDQQTGDISKGYREEGYYPEAFLNIMAFLGWNPGTEQEMFSLSELIQTFDIQKVNKSGAKFDPDKAKWYNQQYLVRKSDDEIVHDLRADLAKRGIETSINLSSVVRQMKERIVFVKDIYSSAQYFFESPTVFDPKTVKKKWKDNSAEIVTDIAAVFDKIVDFRADNLEASFKKYLEEKELGFGIAMIALRLSITGKGGGPSLFEIAEIIGKNETLKRLKENPEKILDLKA